jgi:hypothetical protein
MTELILIAELIFFVILFLFATSFLAPRSVRYFRRLQITGKDWHFITSFCFGLLALFISITLLMIGLKPFIYSPFPF